MTQPDQPAEMVDWDLAVRIASRLAGQGPEASPFEAAAAVEELRAGAERSTALVRDFTGLVAADHTAPVLVVDRPGWVQANADAFRHLTGPLIDQISSKKPPTGVALAVGSKITAVEIGGLLGFLAGKVLGQFDPFHAPDGRLLLVAPNIVHVEREIGADPSDFRLWVCLHEETHRVQFTAVPWMRDHLFSEVQALSATVSPSGLDDVVKRVADALKGGIGKGGIVELLSTPEQKEILDRVTGMMSLLEGHADVVMDGVGPSVIPSVEDIRTSFTQRRKGVGTLDRLLRRLLGLDAKMAQYRDGAHFVRSVVDKVGMTEFNAVWERAEHLPSKAELADPDAWVGRVLGLIAPVTLDPSVAAVRLAVRPWLGPGESPSVLVACSGGADSLALLAATVFEARRTPFTVVGAVVDHGLQEGSADHTARVVAQMASLGVDETASARVQVDPGALGPEAGAREARYAVLDQMARHVGAVRVLLGHTLDDQAETVLLGLARGSGGRSIAGMRRGFQRERDVEAPHFVRPLLGIRRRQTEAACRAEGIAFWTDPHNADPRFARSRVRHTVLPTLERELGPGIADALARTADQLQADTEYLDHHARERLGEFYDEQRGFVVRGLEPLEPAIRNRLLRLAALDAGCPASELTAGHVAALLDQVLNTTHLPRRIQLPGHVTAVREGHTLRFVRAPLA